MLFAVIVMFIKLFLQETTQIRTDFIGFLMDFEKNNNKI